MVIVKEFSQLLAQTFVALALVPKNDGAFEQGVLQLLGQVAPEVGRGRAEDQKVSVGGLVSATADGSDASFMNSPSAHAGFCSRVQFSAPEENGCAPLMFRGGIDDAQENGPAMSTSRLKRSRLAGPHDEGTAPC